jgi:dolichol-phosphate mannosyltransferase
VRDLSQLDAEAEAESERSPGAKSKSDTSSTEAPPPELSIVVPVYNEEGNIPLFYSRVAAVLEAMAIDWELLFCVDPSTDRTENLIADLHAEQPRVKMLRFSRRFGQYMATLAGLEASSGEAVVVIDCDLQDPPELIPEMVEKWHEGFDVVYAQRRSRAGETPTKRLVAALGYRVIRKISDVDIPVDTGDFRLMSRRVVNHVVALKEGHGYLRGLVGFVGFRQTGVVFDREARASGAGNYNRLVGSISGGMNGVIGFSRYPLQVISVIGLSVSLVAFAVAVAYACLKLAGARFPVGNPTIVVLVLFLGGIQLLSLGVVGEYIGRIYDEVRQRPKYIVEQYLGWEVTRTRPRVMLSAAEPRTKPEVEPDRSDAI